MIGDGRTVPRGSRLEADLCVIGAGAAGITIAREFIGRGTSVIVLESGTEAFDADTQVLAGGENVGLPYFPIESTRLRWLGGSTNHWGGVCRPMQPEDFEATRGVPLSGWPIAYEEVRAYYEQARRICGVPTGEWSVASWGRKGRSRPLPLGERIVTRIAQIVPHRARSFRVAHQAGLGAARNVTVLCRSNVTEIETNAAGNLVTRVRARTLDGNHFSVAARHTVLAVGGLENPRILLASNRQWPRGLGNAHDLVGRFFMEHPRFVGGLLMPSDPRLPVGFYDHHDVGRSRMVGYLSIARKVRAAEGLVDVQIGLHATYPPSFERLQGSDRVADLKRLVALARGHGDHDGFGRHLAQVVADLTTWQSVALPGAPLPVPFPELVGTLMRSTPAEAQALVPDVLGDLVGRAYARVLGAPVDHVQLRTRIDPVPNPDSRVTLGERRDALGLPELRLDWRLTALDRHSVRRSLEILGAELGRAGLGRVRILLDEEGREWPEDLAGGWHHMGTTRMADDPRHGVVDRLGRVHGIPNLMVAGSSVFPTAGSGTPTMTIVALALRLADHLKGVMA